MTTTWLDRRICPPGPFLTLCLSQDEYRAVALELESPEVPHWTGHMGADAATHTFENTERGLVCVVCIRNIEKATPIEVAGVLVHEAVHVWQRWCESYGEDEPGAEQEAYAIQNIAQILMTEYARRVT